MSTQNTFLIGVLYDSHQAFLAELDAAFENVRDHNDRARLAEIEDRYETDGDLADLSTDEHDLIKRLAGERRVIGPTDV